MIRTGIYPGTFDPITFGHIDIIKKSLKIVDKLIVAISDSSEKNYLFSTDERIEILQEADKIFIDILQVFQCFLSFGGSYVGLLLALFSHRFWYRFLVVFWFDFGFVLGAQGGQMEPKLDQKRSKIEDENEDAERSS